MSKEQDRGLFPGLLEDAFAISLGAAYKSVEMMKRPQESMEKVMAEAVTLVSVPSDAGEGLKSKAESLAAVWIEKSAILMHDCKTAGEKFTEGK